MLHRRDRGSQITCLLNSSTEALHKIPKSHQPQLLDCSSPTYKEHRWWDSDSLQTTLLTRSDLNNPRTAVPGIPDFLASFGSADTSSNGTCAFLRMKPVIDCIAPPFYSWLIPPSATISVPSKNEESELARNKTVFAISSGNPKRFIGTLT